MSFIARTKDDPGDVGRAADQQQSIDNEAALFAALLGPATPPPGIVRQFVKKLSIPDNSATIFATITTTNETGDVDGGAYSAYFRGFVAHGLTTPASTVLASKAFSAVFTRVMRNTGVGANSAVSEVYETASAATDAATKDLSTVTMTVAETSEYVQSLTILLDLTGTGFATGEIYGVIEVTYSGFTTPPIIQSAGEYGLRENPFRCQSPGV